MPSKRKEKKSLILYYDYIEQFKMLDDKQLRQLIYAMIEYDKNGNEIELDNMTKMAFIPIKRQLKQDKEEWQETCETNRKNIQKYWDKIKGTNTTEYDRIRMNTMATDNDNDNDNDNDTDNDNMSKKKNIKKKKSIYEFIEENFGRLLSPIEYQEISSWEDNELTRYAIKDAVLNGKHNIKYISRILDNYKKNSIITVQQAQEATTRYKERTKYKSSYDKANEVYERFLGGES